MILKLTRAGHHEFIMQTIVSSYEEARKEVEMFLKKYKIDSCDFRLSSVDMEGFSTHNKKGELFFDVMGLTRP